MKGISLVLVILLLFGVPLLCEAQPEEEEEPIQTREINKVATPGEASAVHGTATKAGNVSATPIHLPNPQTQGVQRQVETTSGVQGGATAGQVSSAPKPMAPAHPANELKGAGAPR
ncbi:MAG: hypothetical protein JRF69_11500 [Deltaproteobacteria bacterium]|nr:hypothetical protein [Deltaproteobacteria bacterium]